jgi:hypothetical protein
MARSRRLLPSPVVWKIRSTKGEQASGAEMTWTDHWEAKSLPDLNRPGFCGCTNSFQRIEDDQTPVRVCRRSLSGRLDRLHFDDTLRQGLPIGSGEIESAHRFLVQHWLKCPGAGWRTHNAEPMLTLRLNRANHRWRDYWKKSLPRHRSITSV